MPDRRHFNDGGKRGRNARDRGIARAAPAGGAPDPPVAAEQVGRSLHALAHELNNLIDGSMRCLRLARRGLDVCAFPAAEAGGALRHLDTVDHALAQMADLLKCVVLPGGLAGGHAGSRPLIEAIEHAADVVAPLAGERGVELVIRIDASLRAAPPAPIYTVVSNALRNAVDAAGRGGRVELHAEVRKTDGGGASEVCIEVLDDGPGPPTGAELRAFDPGYSTKPGSSGLGLALARDIVAELGGELTLSRRWEEGRGEDGRRFGGRLYVRYPAAPPPANGRAGLNGGRAA